MYILTFLTDAPARCLRGEASSNKDLCISTRSLPFRSSPRPTNDAISNEFDVGASVDGPLPAICISLGSGEGVGRSTFAITPLNVILSWACKAVRKIISYK